MKKGLVHGNSPQTVRSILDQQETRIAELEAELDVAIAQRNRLSNRCNDFMEARDRAVADAAALREQAKIVHEASGDTRIFAIQTLYLMAISDHPGAKLLVVVTETLNAMPEIEAMETALLVGDEGCFWKIEGLRVAVQEYQAASRRRNRRRE